MDALTQRSVLIVAMIDAMKNGGSSLDLSWGEGVPEDYWAVAWITGGLTRRTATGGPIGRVKTTRIRPDGKRTCRICQAIVRKPEVFTQEQRERKRIRNQQWYLLRKQSAAGRQPTDDEKGHCNANWT